MRFRRSLSYTLVKLVSPAPRGRKT
jgi:hypothetical protein